MGTRKPRKKKLSWDDLINFRQRAYKKEILKPLLHGMSYRGAEVSREIQIDGPFKKVIITYEKGDVEILEWVGKIRIK